MALFKRKPVEEVQPEEVEEITPETPDESQDLGWVKGIHYFD